MITKKTYTHSNTIGNINPLCSECKMSKILLLYKLLTNQYISYVLKRIYIKPYNEKMFNFTNSQTEIYETLKDRYGLLLY